jgi:hypothetical protein
MDGYVEADLKSLRYRCNSDVLLPAEVIFSPFDASLNAAFVPEIRQVYFGICSWLSVDSTSRANFIVKLPIKACMYRPTEYEHLSDSIAAAAPQQL